MPMTDVRVQFRKVGGKICPVSLAVDRNGIWPDDKGKLPDPQDGNLLEGLLGSILGTKVGVYDTSMEKALTPELKAEITGAREALEKAVTTFHEKVSKVQKHTGYPKERAASIVGAMVGKLKEKGK